jgi:hypothetical protein
VSGGVSHCGVAGVVVLPSSRGQGGASDVARVVGSGGAYQVGVPLQGYPVAFCHPSPTLPSIIDSLTSRLDGEEVVGWPFVHLRVLDPRRSQVVVQILKNARKHSVSS